MNILKLNKLNTYYGISHILFDVSLNVKRGEMVCLLGRNGVGKTTVLKSIMGIATPSTGTIEFEEQEIQNFATYRIARLGIGYVPENRIIFPGLTVYENLEMGIKDNSGDCKWTIGAIYEIFPRLSERKNQKGGTLSGGEQQMLTIARTLLGNPKILLLDEPSEGLAPLMVKNLYETVKYLKSTGIAILLTEQNSEFALRVSEKAYILEKGNICWKGSAESLRSAPEIMKKHLGI